MEHLKSTPHCPQMQNSSDGICISLSQTYEPIYIESQSNHSSLNTHDNESNILKKSHRINQKLLVLSFKHIYQWHESK